LPVAISVASIVQLTVTNNSLTANRRNKSSHMMRKTAAKLWIVHDLTALLIDTEWQLSN